MAFKEVADLSADVTVSLGGVNKKTGKKNPTKAEGYYLGRREVPDNKKKSGVSYIYFFQTDQGTLGVWGKTDMDRKMGSVPTGAMTKVEYDRMVATANGEMYKYKVAVDMDNSIEVATTSSTHTDSDSSFAEEEGLDEDTDDSGAEDELQAAALAAAERKAKVAALLGGKKSKVG